MTTISTNHSTNNGFTSSKNPGWNVVLNVTTSLTDVSLTSRALDARRSTLDRVPLDALFLIACSRRVSVHYNIIERYSFHANFSASRSHLSTAAAGTSPLSPPCSTHVSLGLGGGASAPSPPPALGGSPKNLMA